MGPDLWEMFEDGKADDEVAAIIRLGHHSVLPKGVRLVTQFSEIITVRMTRADVLKVSGAPEVVNMVAGDTYLGPDIETETMESVDLSIRATDERRPKEEKATGAGVVVGVVDWGFDFAHPDFRKKDGTTRILALWDQRGSRRPGSPQPFGYGVVHDREAINQALKTADPYAALGYHPADADTGIGCHGTHVLSIAAGSGVEDRPSGIAPEADLVVVHNAPWDEAEPSRLGDSVTVLEGIDFIARTAGERPWVINLSMGRHSGFHNGQELVEQGFDAAVRSTPGRAISLSAGNYFAKNIHASGQLRPTQTRTLIWEIKQGDPTNNQIEFWYSWQDKMELAVRSPDGSLQATVKIGERAKLVSGGKEVGNVYHRGQDPISLNNLISVFLYPEAPPGDWQLTLVGTDVIDGRYHAWIERDVSCPRCQSYFRAEDADPRSTTGTICNGRRTFAVGAYNGHSVEPRIAPFSSCGPTLDGRLKPDLCAPGVAILAARSATRDKNNPAPLLTRMSGTSMASPCVTGTIALMFQAASRRLRIEETHNLLLATAEKISIPDEIPDRIGIGFLDVSAAVEAARKIDGAAPTFKETTVEASVNAGKSIAVTKAANREAVEVAELEDAMEERESVSAGFGCECKHAHVSVQERQDEQSDFFEELYVAEDNPKAFDISAPPKEVANALAAKDWAGALSAAIKAGVRDQNVLTDLVFFARHHELPVGPLDPKGQKFKALSSEWGQILNDEVWKAIQTASENSSLVVSGAVVTDNDRFFWGASGKRLKKLVEQAAKDVDLNPGLLGTIMMAETQSPQTYLSGGPVSSYFIGTDDFYEGRAQIAARVPAYKKVKWDQGQTPVTHPNDAQKRPREVKSILFDSGPDAILATAVYAKFREVRLREVAKTLNGDFDKLPVEVRLALTRIAMAAGTEGAKPFLKDALAGRDIFIRKDIPTAIYQTQRNATVRTAQALHLSEWIFGINLGGAGHTEAFEFDDREETEEGLRKKLEFLSFLPHFVRSGGNDVSLTPAAMNPGIYDGPAKYKIAEGLQKCLNTAVDNRKFGHIRVALVDLTKDVLKPEFAGFNHKDQVFAASLPKIAAMLAAFQLRHDLEAALTSKGSSAQEDLFSSVRDGWAATQEDPKGAATPFSDGVTIRGKLVLWKDKKVELGSDIPKSPTLESIFPKANFPSIKFSSTGETKDELSDLIKEFDSASAAASSIKQKTSSADDKVKADAFKKLGPAQARLNKATHKLQSLGFLERLRVAMGGMVPASNFIVSTIVKDVGYPYIASTLLQSGLYDPSREGGLWLGASYWDSTWRGALKGGSRQSATAGSAAAFMTLLAQDRLVDPASSAEMRALIHKEPNPTHPGIVSWFKEGLKQLPDEGSIETVLSKLGAFEGIDDCAFIERKVDSGTKVIRYVAVGLRARKSEELKALILELDKCILANNSLTAAQGGHSAEVIDAESSFVQAEIDESLRVSVPVERILEMDETKEMEETSESEATPVNATSEDSPSSGQDCSAVTVDCLFPPDSDLKKIRPKGKREGDFIDRTEGDRTVNLALQLVDYDVNGYLTSKQKHAEALGRIREFVVNRLVQTTEPIAITITGSASRTGGKDYNDQLSCKRARCAADNLRRSFDASVLKRVTINSSGEGFTRATCKGSDCELGEFRSVLVQVHAPNSPPRPIPVVDPGWDKYTIRCCSFHTENVVSALLGDLLKKVLPQVPDFLRGKIQELIGKGLKKLVNRLLKELPKLERLVQGLSEVLEEFPAEIIRETGVFEIRERDKSNPRGVTLCYSGFGFRILLPRQNIDEFLDDVMNKISFFKSIPDAVRKQVKDAIKKLLPKIVRTLIQPIESATPGPLARFDLRHPQNIRVFEGSVQLGKGFFMPGQVNVEFNSAPWRRPDPVQRPAIVSCPDTSCNESGIQAIVGNGEGFELFSITQGDLVAGPCVCGTGADSLAQSLTTDFNAIETVPADLLEVADEFVLENARSASSVSVVAEMFERRGASEALVLPGENRSISAAEVFDALTSRRQTELRRHLEQHFEVVGLPNTPLSQDVRAADLMIRRGYGDTGHVAIIAQPQLKNVQELLVEGLMPESVGSGNYVQVIEGGLRAHSSSDQFARQLTDSFGRLMNDILLVRLATQPTVVQVQPQPSKSGDDPDIESTSAEDCSDGISEFGRAWRLAHDSKRNPRPQLQRGRPLCAGRSDLKRHGANDATLDLLLFNFDIDGSYTKTQHEAAMDRLISLIHDNITANPSAGSNDAAYEISLQGYADRTGSARYNEFLANDRERAVESYINENIDRFRKPSESSIRERVRYTRMKGGFAPDALPGKNTPHARAVLVWAVPVGGEKPQPRPAPSNRLDPNYWFLPAEEIGRRAPAFTEGNEVLALIDGSKYMADLLTSLNSCDRGLYLAGWRFTGQQLLNPADPSPIPMIDAVRNTIPRGARVRAMIYKVLGSGFPGPFRVWHAEDNRIFCEALKAARQDAVLDARFSPKALSAHHQKFAVVESSKPDQTVAYVGGIDLCLDRWDSPSHSSNCPKPDPVRQCDIIEFYASQVPAPSWIQLALSVKGLISTHFPSQPGWHDVQARVRGPALQQIWEVFRDRWNDPRPANKDSATPNCQIVTPISGQAPQLPQVSLGTSWVQVTQTLPCMGAFGPYPFAPRGEQTIEKAYIRAIDRAESYIYIEDQYLWPSLLVDRLVDALKRNVHVVILVARDFDLVGLTAVHARMRGQVINQLRAANASRFKVFHLQQPAGGQIYVHAKTMIIDDMVAFIGSANLNHRSMTNDTELQLGILDSSSVSVPINGNFTRVSKFAHEYRCELWEEHLGVSRTQILDPIVAINAVWANAPGPNRRVFPHQISGNLDLALLAEVIANLVVEFGIQPIPELPPIARSLSKKAIQEAIELALRGSSQTLGKVINWLAGILNPRLGCQQASPLWKGSGELHYAQLRSTSNAHVDHESA